MSRIASVPARRAGLAGVLGFAVAMSVGPAAGADDNPFRLKPGARGKACIECHVEFGEVLAKKAVHSPVAAGECVDCHSPHAADHGKLLAAEPDRICTTCHEDVVASDAVSVHTVVLEGNCVSCHDPHASDRGNQLLAAGNELCKTCHDTLATAASTAAFPHAPAQDDCISCHDPHASTKERALLKAEIGALCTDCHDATQPAFVKDHGSYPVTEGRCSSCHNPHGSDNRGILWASVHRPMANGMCSTCHYPADAENALDVKRPGSEGCRTCHAEIANDALSSANVHWPMADDDGCLNCHGPHATPERKLLSAAPKALCGSCHADTMDRQARAASKHAPAEAGECSTCHEPHGSDNAFLFTAADQFELCGTCHDWEGHSAHPIGATAVDPRNPNLTLDCSSCHRTHGTDHDHLAPFDVKRDLCVQCHSGIRR